MQIKKKNSQNTKTEQLPINKKLPINLRKVLSDVRLTAKV